MVLTIIDAIVHSAYFPSNYVPHIIVSMALLYLLRAFSQGKRTNRERDLHARVVVMTGAFTPLGLTTMQDLAKRGAHIIALTEDDVESPESRATILVDLLRSTTSNQEIYAERCDLYSHSSIEKFCAKFMTGENSRIDALLMLHEYQHIGPFSFLSRKPTVEWELERQTRSLATFHLVTTLLPGLLLAPGERDIRIISVVNRFYAAAATKAFTLPFSSFVGTPVTSASLLISEGSRALKTIILNRHLQRVLDALPTAQVPKTDTSSSAIPVVNPKSQKSNIVAVTVSPGISRVDTVSSLLHADWPSPFGWSWTGVIIYLFLQPLLRIFAKSPFSAMQTVLHALFLPTPFKVLAKEQPVPNERDKTSSLIDKSVLEAPEEVLKPGALYAECAVVKLSVPAITSPEVREKASGKVKEAEEPALDIPDDGELGGEVMGRAVWEAYEAATQVWKQREPEKPKAQEVSDQTSNSSK